MKTEVGLELTKTIFEFFIESSSERNFVTPICKNRIKYVGHFLASGDEINF